MGRNTDLRYGIRFLRAGVLLAAIAGLVAVLAAATEDAGARQARQCRGVKATIVGNAGSETIRGTGRRDVIVGLGGNDEIDGRGGRDLLCGNGGDDAIDGGRSGDKISGSRGEDLLLGGSGRDEIYGNENDDLLGGDGGRPDLCSGGPGTDLAAKTTCEKIRSATAV